MRLLRFGGEEYSRVLLDMQASLMGLGTWQEVVSPEEKKYAHKFSHVAHVGTAQFQKASGEDGSGALLRMILLLDYDATSW